MSNSGEKHCIFSNYDSKSGSASLLKSIPFKFKRDSLPNSYFLGPGLGSIDLSLVHKLISFHGYLSTGALIGLQMLVLGWHLLDISENDRIHVVCETVNCLPDAFQILAQCTIGNKHLTIRDTGKMAVTMTLDTPPGEIAHGVRIILDPGKTRKFKRLYAWYMNTERVEHDELVEILRQAGASLYSYQFVDIPVTAKRKKQITICSNCGEPFVEKQNHQTFCLDCCVMLFHSDLDKS